MLGRLFNSKSNSSLSELSSPTISSLHSSPSSSLSSPPIPKAEHKRSDNYTDAYTRALLYGTPTQLTTAGLDNSAFRIIIIQDGIIRSRSVLYDSAAPYQQQPQQQQQQPQQSLMQSPMAPSAQQQQQQPHINSDFKVDNSKYHNAMELADYMFGCGVPIIENSTSTKLHSLPSLPKTPSSTLITRLFSVSSKFTMSPVVEKFDDDWNPRSSLPLPHPAASKDLTRFAIGFVVPLDIRGDVESAITSNWEEYINFMASYQANVISKLKLQCTIKPHACVALKKYKKDLINKRLAFPSYVLQGDYELQHHLNSFIKLAHSVYQVPRLLVGTHFSDSRLFNWCHHVAAWLEYKDGRNLTARLEFLASLFMILIPVRRALVTNKPSDKTKQITRVVIMTGNPMVVQKLIFIIIGILADDVLGVDPVANSDDSDDDGKQDETIIAAAPVEMRKLQSYGSNEDSFNSATPSLGSSFAKGWEIPQKNTPSIPTNTVTVKPVNFSPTKSSGENSSASLQYLSSSLSSSYNSSSWKQMSFFDKWRSSTSTVINNDHMNNGLSNNSNNNSSGLASTFNPQIDGISKVPPYKKPSNFRTPSPAVEYEEYPWSNNMSTMHSFQAGRLNRNQSSFDLSILANNSSSKYNANAFHIERTPATIKGAADLADTYQRECRAIMSCDGAFDVVEDEVIGTNVLETAPLDEYLLNDEIADLSIDHQGGKAGNTQLRPLVGYIDEFQPEFSLQACPIKVGLDQEIINAMKNDLVDHSFTRLASPKVVSKTIFVSLAAREIKEFEIRSMGAHAYAASAAGGGGAGAALATAAGTAMSTSPTSPALANEGITVRKLFSPRKRELDSRKVQRVDELLDSIIEVAKSIKDENRLGNNSSVTITRDGNGAGRDDKDKLSKIRGLMNEMFLAV